MFDEEMATGTTSQAQNYLATLRRHRRWVLLTIFLCWGAALGLSWLLRAEYRSEAVILVEEQKVTEQLVEPNIRYNLQARLLSMEQQVLSSPRLQSIIDRFHLYSQRPNWFGARDVVDEMRRDIGDIELVTSPGPSGRQANLTAF